MIKNFLTKIAKLGKVYYRSFIGGRKVKKYSIKELTDRSKPMSYDEMIKQLNK